MSFFSTRRCAGGLRCNRIAPILATLWALAALSVHAEPTWGCVEPALRKELERKLEFQDDFAATVISLRPDFDEIATLAASASKEAFKVRFLRIAWLWENDRVRLSHADAFWSYRWDEDDTTAWRLADNSHVAAHDLETALKKRLQEHPDAKSYGSFGSENRGREPFLGLLTDFGTDISTERDRIAACF